MDKTISMCLLASLGLPGCGDPSRDSGASASSNVTSATGPDVDGTTAAATSSSTGTSVEDESGPAMTTTGGGESSTRGGEEESPSSTSEGNDPTGGVTSEEPTTAGDGGSTGGDPSLECDGATVVLCEDFELGMDAWTIEGSAEHEQDPTRVHAGDGSLRVDFRDPECGPQSCDENGNNCFENYPQVVSKQAFSLERYYVSWWVYYPEDFTFYQGPCLPDRGWGGHFVRFANFHTPADSNDPWYQGAVPDFGQERADGDAIRVRAQWEWEENEGPFTVARNLIGTAMAVDTLAGRWNRYELFVDLGSVGGYDGEVAWSVNDEVHFALRGDAVVVGEIGAVWGDQANEAAMHPSLLRTSATEAFTRLGLVSNPNSSFGGRPGDVYWIDDLLISSECPTGRPVCDP